MKYYTDGTNLYAYELDGSQDAYIREGLTQITDAEADVMRAAKAQAFQSELTYVQQRQAEYPSIAEQLDMIFHGGVDGWKAQIQAIKDKYPK
jgi:hypothetical protein